MRWPQYSINDVYLNFHASAPASLSNEFLSFQHYLLARAPIAHYNSAAVFLNPLLDPAEEDSYYASVVSSASPAVTAPPNQDFGTSDVFNWLLNIWRFNPWGAGGVSNQMEFRLSYLMNFLRRGYTGGYLSAAHFYNLVADEAFPRSDGFDWRDKPGSQKDYWDFPNATSANSALTSNNQIEADGGHQYWWGMPTFYFLSGDETIKDALLDGPKDAFLDATSTNNWMTSGRAASARSVGNILSGAARMASFLSDIGDSTSAATVLNRASVVWSLQIKPELCASGYPAGCTPSQGGCDTGTAQRGTSKVRGVTFQFCETIRLNGCPGYPNNSDRTFSPFMNGILLRGMRELRAVMGSSWPDYNALTDTAYGIVQANFGEMYADNGSNSWSANGFRYKEALDVPNSCNVGSGGAGNDYNFMVQNPDAFWPLFHYLALYEGSATTNVWQRRFNQELQQVISGGSAIKDELWQMEVANVIYAILHPSGLSLATQPITGFVDNGGGSYTISWTVPAGAQSYRIKWGSKRIVDWIGFDSGVNAFIGDPTTTMNWFAATDAANVPAPSGTSQSITINTGTNGLTAVNFMVKAYASGTGGTPTPPPADTTAPTVSITSPAAGSTLQGTVTVTASASDNVGVTGVQFLLDGAAVGGIVTSSPYTYSWNTSNTSKGSHTISATATDAAGNIGTSAQISVSVNNTTAAPVISSVAASNVTTSEAVITWTTSTPADSQVNYGGTAGYGSVTPLVSSMVTAHVATISGLNPSTTYHFSVLSRDAQGNLATSADFTFTTSAVASGGGTAPPVGTWTALTPHGPPAQILGYDKSVYVPDTGVHCLWGAYHQIISSEMQQAVVCFNYAENRWFILETNGAWGNEHIGEAGHSLGIWAYSPDDHVIVGMSDFSGSSTSGQKWLLHSYWIDPVGLTSRDKAFSPRPLPASSVVQSAMVYDSFNKRMILFPDANGVVETCVLSSNSCSRPTTTGTGPGNRGWQSMAYNPADHKVYLFGGTDGATHNEMYTFDAATNTWALLTTTCVGTDCVSGRPPARQAAGMAYSTADKVFLMAGGLSNGFGSGTAFTDTWIFDPATRVWTEQSPSTRYTNGTVNTTFDRVTYDEANNVFVLFAMESAYADGTFNSYGGRPYVYPYSAPLNYERITSTYSPASGSLNRNTSSAAAQSWALDPAIAASGSTVYAGAIETGSPFDTSNCGSNSHPYVQSTPNTGTWASLGSTCTAIDSESSQNNGASQLKLTVANGVLWEAHEKWNNTGALYSRAYAKYWNGSSWTGGEVGCYSATCDANHVQKPASLIAVGSVPTLAVIEWQSATAYMPEGNLYVTQWNGSSWSQLGSGRLNINGSGTRANYAALATDGTYPAVCWTEEVNADRLTTTTKPQLQCKRWNGSSWVRFGSSSLNQDTNSWAGGVSMTYVGGSYYIAWTERTTTGNSRLYVCQWNGTACTLLGGSAVNIDPTNGWATHPSLITDGTNLYIGWEEQAAIGQHALGHVKQWNGSAWSSVGGAVAANAAQGSIEGFTLATVQGQPTAVWAEISNGNLRQTYVKQWNGSVWAMLGSSGQAVTATCDLNGDGRVDSVDVQIAIDQALGVASCSTADLQGTGKCSVIGVQRVINASLGAACMIGQ